MKTQLLICLILLGGALLATPRGLTQREPNVEGEISVIQPEASLQQPSPVIGAGGEIWREDWIPELTEEFEVLLPAGQQFGLGYSGLDASASVFSSLGTLLPQGANAIGKAPSWIRAELRAKLTQLDPGRQILFSDLINNAADPYVDEIAFCVATSSKEYLNSNFALPQLFLENAVWIYSVAGELPYVEIVDTGNAGAGGDYYSTTRYWSKDANGQSYQQTVPREIYYWYLVQPKITDEIAAYIDPAVVENNSTHSNNIVPPPTGKFWRSYFYDFEEDGYPVLSDTLSLCQTVFNRDGSVGDAVRAIIWWINQNMSFTSNSERPHQPVRIFEKRFGRCGEYADFTSAVTRTALIPCTSISSISTDHTWNEFWDEGWVSWEPVNGYLNNPLVYENGWGKVFGSVFDERCDGLFTPVTERYSEGEVTLNIQVVDSDLRPVDGARVVLAIFETSPRFDCQLYTDNNGLASFKVGENRDYRARAETFFGLYPANPGTYAQLVQFPVDGETYNYQFQIAAQLPLPAVEELAPPPDPVQDYRFVTSFQSTGYYIGGRALWDDIEVLGTQPGYYQKVDLAADAAYMATDADNLLFLQLDNFCSAYSYSLAGSGANSFDIPAGQNWYAFLDNSHRHGNATLIGGTLAFELWGTPVNDPQVPAAVWELSAAAPNPTRSKTRLTLDLPAAAEVSLAIFNLRGQQVRGTGLKNLPQGSNEIAWDGNDDRGTRVPAGIYLLQVTSGGLTATRKVAVTE